MPSFKTAFTPAKRYKFALVKTAARSPNVGLRAQQLQVLETYQNSQRIEAVHDLRVHRNNGTQYRLVRLQNNQKVTKVPTMFSAGI